MRLPSLAFRVVARLAVLVALALLLAPTTANAHVRSTTGFSEITQEGGQVQYRLSLEYDLLVATVGLGQDALDASSDTERNAVLTSSQQRIAAYLEPEVGVFLDGVACRATLDTAEVQRRESVPYAVVTTSYECPGSTAGGYSVRYGVFMDSGSAVDQHTNLVSYDLDGQSGQYVFDRGHQELSVGEVGVLSSSLRFLTMGVEHIATGLDHVLFVVVLLLGAAGFRSVMKLALAFTAAHSVTLALAALGWVEVPAAVVEPLIALSIAYLAAENLLGGETRHRLPVTFGFGLLHGLGFASALTFDTDVTWQVLWSLLTFNLGIEVGQALIILTLFPLLLVVRRRFEWSRLAHSLAAAAIAALGTSWFFGRLLA